MPTRELPADVAFDLTDPAIFGRTDLSALWQRLHTESPVARHPATAGSRPFWVLSRHQDVLAVLRDSDRYVSGAGNMLDSLAGGGDPAGGQLLAVMDPPRHTELRAALLKTLSRRVLRGVADKVRQRADARVAAAVAQGACDFAADVADHIPMGTICDLLGVPEPDRAELLGLSKQALSSDEAGQTAEDAWLARNEILLYFSELAARRRADPREDLVTALTTAEVGGERLTDDEVVLNCYGLILAGDETSRLAASGTVWSLIRFPDQWAALRDGQVEISSAVEEFLRWTSPVMHVARTTAADVRLGDHVIPPGEIVTAWIAAANRDPAVFAEPDRLDLGRAPNRHLGFGFGPHFCLGSHLGRLELTAVAEALVRHVAAIESLGPPKPVYSTFLQGYSSMPVHLHPKPGGGNRS